jgi:uncharacterized protein (DUF427 family)
MAVTMRELIGSSLAELRCEPTAKRLRASVGGQLVADTGAGLLVWEPRRVVPTYAIAAADLSASLIPAGAADPEAEAHTGFQLPDVSNRPVLDPSIPFRVHSCPGTSFDVVVGARTVPAAAFRPDDPDLTNHVVLDFAAFDWLEEQEPVVSHPHDPFHRIDTLRSDRQVRVELDGRLLAESSRAVLLFETLLPVRFYLPRDDVAVPLKESDTVTYCAYKGRASYLSPPHGPADIAWSYPEPLHDAEPVKDRIAFFDERVDVVVDGVRRQRPITPWSSSSGDTLGK